MINSGLFTSTTDLWSTPIETFKRLDDIYHFELDVCTEKENQRHKWDSGLANYNRNELGRFV